MRGAQSRGKRLAGLPCGLRDIEPGDGPRHHAQQYPLAIHLHQQQALARSECQLAHHLDRAAAGPPMPRRADTRRATQASAKTSAMTTPSPSMVRPRLAAESIDGTSLATAGRASAAIGKSGRQRPFI